MTDEKGPTEDGAGEKVVLSAGACALADVETAEAEAEVEGVFC